MYAPSYPTLVVRRRRRPSRTVRRWVAILVLAGLLALLGPLVANVMASTDNGSEEAIEVTVRAGDTLWGIAEEYAAPGEDIRKTIFRIREANGLRTAVLHPGQVLAIPGARR